jgi:hypothetical protein
LTKQATFMAHAYAKTARELFGSPRNNMRSRTLPERGDRIKQDVTTS